MKIQLERIISDVEASKIKDFQMNLYDKCILGKIYGIMRKDSKVGILKAYLNITKPEGRLYFSEHSKSLYSPEEWAVVRLFTKAIGINVSKETWLELAKTQLAKMK